MLGPGFNFLNAFENPLLNQIASRALVGSAASAASQLSQEGAADRGLKLLPTTIAGITAGLTTPGIGELLSAGKIAGNVPVDYYGLGVGGAGAETIPVNVSQIAEQSSRLANLPLPEISNNANSLIESYGKPTFLQSAENLARGIGSYAGENLSKGTEAFQNIIGPGEITKSDLLNKEEYSLNDIISWEPIQFSDRNYDDLKKIIEDGYKPCSAWFESMVKKLKYDKRKVSQELECNFLGSGDNVFDSNMMQNIRENMIREPQNKMMGNSLWIWKEPVLGHKYIMGVDVSRGDSEDFSSFQIIDFDEREQVAEFVGKLPPDTMAEICYKWANMYSCFIVIDITGGMGVSTSRKLQEMGYKDLYVDGVDTANKWKYDPKATEKIPGINFNNKRVQIIASFEEAMRHEFKIYSSRLFNEMNTFIYINGRPDHQKGQHDDLIMSVAMACYVAESSFTNLKKVTEQTKAMLDSWSVSNNDNVSKQIEFNPVIPNNTKNLQSLGRENISKEEYLKYGWLFGVR